MSSNSYDYNQEPLWRRDLTRVTAEELPEHHVPSFSQLSPPDAYYSYDQQMFYSNEHLVSSVPGYDYSSGPMNDVLQDPTVRQSMRNDEPWSAIGSRLAKPLSATVTPSNYLGPYGGPYTATSQAPSQLSESAYDAPGEEAPESVHSADVTSERRYKAPVSPRRASGARSTRSRTSSVISAQTSTSTKRKVEGVLYRCPECNYEARTESELKKHHLRHFKPNLCDIPGCTWAKGFTTPNDVWRHKASLHRVYQPGAKVYVCASQSCYQKAEKQNKHWPRLDNFRQHIERMHPGENVDDLVARSTVNVDPQNQEGLPRHLMRTHMLQATEHGVLVALNPDPTLAATGSASASVRRDSLKPPVPARPRRLSSGSRRSNARLPSTPSAAGSRQPPGSATSAVSRSSQQVPPAVVLHQPRSESFGAKSAPLTDADQLHQLSKAISDACTEGSSPTQDTILKALQNFQKNMDQSDEGSPVSDGSDSSDGSDRDAAGDIDMDHLASIESSATSLSDRSLPEVKLETTRSEQPQEGRVVCPVCHKVLRRECDLRKHQMRHDKPFGCTFDNCYKKFGSKNDWKRHEQSQHFQNAMWTCRFVTGSGRACAHLYESPDQFRRHLVRAHSVKDDVQLDQRVDEGHIAHNGVTSFWCGFAGCQRVIKCQEKNTKAWDERFDHIGKHLTSGLFERMEDWLPPRGYLTKGHLRERKSERSAKSEEPVYDDSDTSDGMCDGPEVDDVASDAANIDPNKLSLGAGFVNRSSGSSGSKRRRPSAPYYCCSCKEGPTLSPSCQSCFHNACDKCVA